MTNVLIINNFNQEICIIGLYYYIIIEYLTYHPLATVRVGVPISIPRHCTACSELESYAVSIVPT